MAAVVALTLSEACELLDPPVTEKQLRQIVTALGWQPAGTRRNGHPGRPGRQRNTYDWARLAALHKAILPFLPAPGVSAGESPW